MHQNTTPNSPQSSGGSRGWRRHMRRWKSAHSLAAQGNKTARTWLAKHGLPLPPHPHDRTPKSASVESQRPAYGQTTRGALPHSNPTALVLKDLPMSRYPSNRCPLCSNGSFTGHYKQTEDAGMAWLLTCKECQGIYQPHQPEEARLERTRAFWLALYGDSSW